MKIGDTVWLSENWGIYKFRRAAIGRVCYCVAFSRDMVAPYWSIAQFKIEG